MIDYLLNLHKGYGRQNISTTVCMGGETMSKGRVVLPVLLSCVVVMIGMTGMAYAGTVKISVAEFTSDGFSAPFDYIKSFAAGTLSVPGAANPCLIAAVKIPATATRITKLTVYLSDDGSGASPPAFLLSGLRPSDGTATAYANASVTTGTQVVQGFVVPLMTRNITPGQNIALGLCLSAGQVFYGAKVNYQ
jgi:hypothetical protein